VPFQVNDIFDDAEKILGACDEKQIFSKLSDVVEVLCNTGDFDPLVGTVDICTDGDMVTLPRDIAVPTAVNIGGHPTLGRDQLFNFHYNGPGDCKASCSWTWDDKGLVPTYRELKVPSKLVAFVNKKSDEGKELWAYGFDASNNVIRTEENGKWVNGYRIPTIFGYALPDADAPLFARVSRIRKVETDGTIRLSSFDGSATTGTLLGVFQWDETDPQYRRIKLGQCCNWVRLAYRRRIFRITDRTDLIPFYGMVMVKMMLNSLKFYDEGDIARGTTYEVTARRLFTESISANEPNTQMPLIVNNNCDMLDQRDVIN